MSLEGIGDVLNRVHSDCEQLVLEREERRLLARYLNWLRFRLATYESENKTNESRDAEFSA